MRELFSHLLLPVQCCGWPEPVPVARAPGRTHGPGSSSSAALTHRMGQGDAPFTHLHSFRVWEETKYLQNTWESPGQEVQLVGAPSCIPEGPTPGRAHM